MKNNKYKILIVDDDPDVLAYFSIILEGNSYNIISESDGIGGLYTAELEKPDLVIVDFMMPGMDGVDFFVKFRFNPSNKYIPFLFVTARDAEVWFEEIKNDRAEFLQKPFHSSELLDLVVDMLNKYSTEDDHEK
jgi:DNA-binding response OmpR family regulator